MPSLPLSFYVIITNLRRTKRLNTIAPPPEDAATRTQRHMRLCGELAEIAMQLARAAATKALAELAEPAAEHAEPAPEPQAERQAEPLATSAATQRRGPTPYLRVPTCKPADPAVLFTRLAATVRDCIALEARLAAGTQARANPSRTADAATLRADPRRTQLRDAIAYLVQNRPDRTELLRDATTRIDEELAADPNQTINLPTLLYNICGEFDIEVDFARLPDASLELLVDPNDPPDPDAIPPPD